VWQLGLAVVAIGLGNAKTRGNSNFATPIVPNFQPRLDLMQYPCIRANAEKSRSLFGTGIHLQDRKEHLDPSGW